MDSEKKFKKIKKKKNFQQIFWTLCVIVLALFTGFSAKSADAVAKVSAQVKFTDPETRRQVNELEKSLEAQQSEIVSLQKELDRLGTENIQIKTENAQIKDEKSELELRLNRKIQSMEEENSTLRKKLLETLRSYSEQSAQLKQLELSVASMIETLNPVHVGQRETELSEALELMRTSGLKLVAKGKDLADAMEQQLQKIDEGSPQYTKVEAMIRAFNDEAGTFATLNVPPGSPEGFEKCNILEVNDELGLVVLSAGYRNGARVNMSLRGGKDGEVLLRIITLRPFVQGAVLEQGKMQDLTAGMEVRVNRVQLQE